MGTWIPRHIEPVAREMLEYFPGVMIEGARQVGKSTLAAQLVADMGAISVTLDDDATRDAAIEDPAGFVSRAAGRPMLIDEIQRFPELTLAVKASIDSDRRPGRFILTGSASLLRVRGLVDSLAGRVGRLQLPGFSQGELAGVRDDFAAKATQLAQLVTEWPETSADYPALVARGGYPEVVALPARMRRRWFQSYLDGMVRRDILELRRQVSPARVDSLLRAIASTQSGELVPAHLASSTAIPATSVTAYLDLLQDIGLVTTLPPWTPNLRRREVGRRKALVTDSGLAAYLARLTPEQLSALPYRESFGNLLEGFVTAELLKQRMWTAADFDLYHFRDRNGLEVDLVLEFDGGQVLAIEVKAAQSSRGAHFNALRTLRDELGDRFIAGVVLTTGTQASQYADRLFGLPIASLWAQDETSST